MRRATEYDFSMTSEELLELCKRQDQEALGVLFKRHEKPVYSMLFRMLSNHEDAEEALAEVFVKVWRAAPGFKGESKFTTWLFRIAANTARDYLRSRKSRPEISVEEVIIDEVEAGRQSGSSYPDPEKSAIQADDMRRIARAMKELSEEDRLLVTLYHFQDLTYEQIAEVTGIVPGNLKVRLFRARQRLKRLCAKLEEGVDDDELRSDSNGTSGLQPGTTDWA